METEFLDGETIVKETAANLQRGIETVGGRLYLSSRRLIFESHPFNIQTGATAVSLDDVVGVRKSWTRFLNVIPVMPNSIAVTTKDGTEYRLVLNDRGGWVEAIKAALS